MWSTANVTPIGSLSGGSWGHYAKVQNVEQIHCHCKLYS